MYYIILQTPPDIHNSEYTAHLIEHIKLGYSEPFGYFNIQKYNGTSYSYYSTYTIDTLDVDLVTKFIEYLISPITSKRIREEKKRIREELEEREYSKKVVESVGKIFYGKDYHYAKSTIASLTDIQTYHSKYYTRASISIFSKNEINTISNCDLTLKKIEVFQFRIENTSNICLITELNSLNLFLFFLFEKLFDNYLDYLDVSSGKYWTRYTIEGEHPNKVWLSYKKSDTNDLTNIPEDFLQLFIQYSIQNIQNDPSNDMQDYDLLSLFHFRYALSMQNKIEIIKNMNSYYVIIKGAMNSYQ